MTESNPWHATTLEWTAPCPPGHGNFGEELPTVMSLAVRLMAFLAKKKISSRRSAPATVTAKH